MVRKLLLCVVLLGATAAGCGSSSGTTTSTSRRSTTTTTSTTKPDPGVAVPVGAQPSTQALMVCADEAQQDIAKSLSVRARVTTPTWVDGVYSCQYVYPKGVVTLSVKELGTAAETTAYFDELGRTLGRKASVGLGEGAFYGDNGSLVVRKDNKVLLVDVSKAPKQFGKFRLPANAVAITMGETIMGCWTGA